MSEFAALYNNHRFVGYVTLDPEKIANFITAERGDKIVTDMMDRTLVSTRGMFLDECDRSIRGKLMRYLTPLQQGDSKPRKLRFVEDVDGCPVEKGSLRAWNKR